jgi:hypothetical protein
MDSFTPIQPILIGDAARACACRVLRERGLMVTAIRPPTVPAGSARLRVTLSAAHSEAQVQLLLNALAECYPSWRPPMRDRLILLPGWGLGTASLEPLAASLRAQDLRLQVS